jgi:hypothetical protein
MELFRKLMILKAVEHPQSLLRCDLELIEKLRQLGQNVSTERVLYFLSRIEGVLSALPRSFNPRVAVEMCLFSLCDPKLCDDAPALLARIARWKPGLYPAAYPRLLMRPRPSAQEAHPLSDTPSPDLAGSAPKHKKRRNKSLLPISPLFPVGGN